MSLPDALAAVSLSARFRMQVVENQARAAVMSPMIAFSISVAVTVGKWWAKGKGNRGSSPICATVLPPHFKIDLPQVQLPISILQIMLSELMA